MAEFIYTMKKARKAHGEKVILDDVTLAFYPGAKIGVVGPNGAGKTTILKLLTNTIKPSAGKLVIGTTVKPAFLSQHLEELNPNWRVLEAVEQVASHVEIGKGKSLSASQLCERLGFTTESQWTPVRDLSGGERRRLQLTRLLMGGPNVLILDEPTNDFDVETLAALEDLLDSFAGTLLVVSHDRYFLERACDTFVGVMGDGTVRDLPKGIDQYLALRAAQPTDPTAFTGAESIQTETISASDLRDLTKSRSKVERSIMKLDEKISNLHKLMETSAADFELINDLNSQLSPLVKEKDQLENEWLDLSSKIDA